MPSKKFRIVFMGTPEFAVASLKSLLDSGFNVVAVVTSPDKPAGRGQKLQESDVKQFAKTYNIPILQPEKLKEQTFIDELRMFQADLQVVVAFRMLPEIVWSMPRLGTINLHASLLPQYRGAAPINWVIINGEKTTGVTTFFIEKEIDTGKIIHLEEITIDDSDNAGTLHDRLMETGAKLLRQTVTDIESGNYSQSDQSSSGYSGKELKIAPKIFKEDCKIDWNAPLEKNRNFIRGLSPYPASWTSLVNIKTNERLFLKIFKSETEICMHSHPSGLVISDEKKYLKIAVAGGYINLLTLQLEGKKRLHIEEFLHGFKNPGDYKVDLL